MVFEVEPHAILAQLGTHLDPSWPNLALKSTGWASGAHGMCDPCAEDVLGYAPEPFTADDQSHPGRPPEAPLTLLDPIHLQKVYFLDPFHTECWFVGPRDAPAGLDSAADLSVPRSRFAPLRLS